MSLSILPQDLGWRDAGLSASRFTLAPATPSPTPIPRPRQPLNPATWIVSGVVLNMIAQGMVFSFPSCLLPALRTPDSTIKTDLETTSWIGFTLDPNLHWKMHVQSLCDGLSGAAYALRKLRPLVSEDVLRQTYFAYFHSILSWGTLLWASSVGAAGIPGFFISSLLMDICGRRLTHILVMLPGVLGWILIYFANNVPLLLTGRILTGVTAGASFGLGAIVIGEYTHPKHRGMFLNLKTASVCMGSLIIHILGNFFNWRTISLLALIPLFVALMITFTWPESPSWLASKKRFDKCGNDFCWLRGKSENSKKELNEMIRVQMDRSSEPIKKVNFSQKTMNFFKKFMKKDFLKPVFIILLGVLLVEASGRHLFPAYALDIIGEVTGDKSQSFYYTLVIDIIITASATCSSVLVKLFKRRTVLFGTGFAALFVLSIVCTYLYLASSGVISKGRPWIPISLFVIYFILANLGCTSIPLAFLGEILPLDHRGAGSVVGGIILSLGISVGLQVTPFLLVSIKVHGTFAVLGAVMGVLLLILYFILPETKDRTLQEIEDYFNNIKFKDEVRVEDDDEESTVKMFIHNELLKSNK